MDLVSYVSAIKIDAMVYVLARYDMFGTSFKMQINKNTTTSYAPQR